MKIWAAEREDAEETSKIPEGDFGQTSKLSGDLGKTTEGDFGQTLREPGTACQVTKNSLKIQAGEGLLVIKEVQPEGKKRMAVDAFLRGYPVEEGEKFGGND